MAKQERYSIKKTLNKLLLFFSIILFVAIVSSIDTILFVDTPSNNSVQSHNSIYINLSTSDGEDHYAFVDFNNDLILWMRMDDTNASGDPTDLSTYSNNGSLEGNALINSSSGYFGNGSYFDGQGDYVSIGDKDIFSPTNGINDTAISFSAWINPDTLVETNYILSKYVGDREYMLIVSTLGALQLSFYKIDDASQRIGRKTDDSVIQADIWHHVVGVYDGNQSETGIDLYVNGVLSDTTSYSAGTYPGLTNTAVPLEIGRAAGAVCFNGTIDEVLIFNRSLSNVEISALYNASANQYYHNFTSLEDAVYIFTGYGVDLSGNKNETEPRSVTVDTHNPQIEILYPKDYVYKSTKEQIFVNFTAKNLIDSCWYNIDDGTNTSIAGCNNFSFTHQTEGLHILKIYANDTLNRETYNEVGFFLDTISPWIELTSLSSNGINSSNNITINCSIYDYTNTYTFIDFNNTLRFMLRMDDVNASGDPYSLPTTFRNNLTTINDAIMVNQSIYGAGFDFDGTGDYLVSPNANGLNFAPDSFTISVWVKPRQVTGIWRVIFEYDRAGGNWFGIWLSDVGKFHFRAGTAISNSNAVLTTDKWYLLTATLNTTEGVNISRQYINGKLDNQTSLGTLKNGDENYAFPEIGNITIGETKSLLGEYFNGTIDEILVFNRILTDEEIRNLYSYKTLDRDRFTDMVKGNWYAQMISNIIGAPYEGTYKSTPNPTVELYFNTSDSSVSGDCSTNADWENCAVEPEDDDDTAIEWLNLLMLETYGTDITSGEINITWQTHLDRGDVYFGNRDAHDLMTGTNVPRLPNGAVSGMNCNIIGNCLPPETGSYGYNRYYDYIDAQIETELFGLLGMGNLKLINKTTDQFARIVSNNHTVDYAIFQAMLMGELMFNDNVTDAIKNVKSEFPDNARVNNVVANVTNWTDTYVDWRDTRALINNTYYEDEYTTYAQGRLKTYWWIHGTSNFAVVIMALLYGDGDFNETMQIAIRAGYDSDSNNIATATVGVNDGYRNIPYKFKRPIKDIYVNTKTNPTVLGNDTITNMTDRTVSLAETYLTENGGSIKNISGVFTYLIPTRNLGGSYLSQYDLGEYNYSYSLYAIDKAGNLNKSEGTITIDMTSPSISSLSPEDGTMDTDGVVDFAFEPTDTNSISSCSLYYQDGLYTTLSPITNGQINTISVNIYEGHALWRDDLQWYITCIDTAGNTQTSAVMHLDTSDDIWGGRGVSSPSFYKNTFVQDQKEFSEIKTITRELKKKERIRIKIKDKSHYIGITELTETTATIEIFSTSQKTVFNISDENKFDVTDDNYYDIYVKLNSIDSNKANLTIKSVYEKIPEEEKEEKEKEKKPEGKIEEKAKLFWLVITLIVIVLVIVIIRYKKKKR